MLDGFQYVLGQIGLVVGLTAVLAATLGWLVGRGSRRRAELAAARGTGSTRATSDQASLFAPTGARVRAGSANAPSDGDEDLAEPEFPTHRLPFGVPPIDHVPTGSLDDADSTAIHPAPVTVIRPVEDGVDNGDASGGTVIRSVPDTTVLRSAPDATVLRPAADATVLRPAADGTVIRPAPETATLPDAYDATVLRETPDATVLRETPDATVLRPAPDMTVLRPAQTEAPDPHVPATLVASVDEDESSPQSGSDPTDDMVAALSPEPGESDVEIGRIEAAALAAWDRTVPMLQQQVHELAAENEGLRRMVRDAEERSDTHASTVSHLAALVAERDTRIAELRARA